MSKNTDTFDTLCGDCAGLDLADITIDDVRDQCAIYGASEDEIQRAIAGLIEYQALAIIESEDGDRVRVGDLNSIGIAGAARAAGCEHVALVGEYEHPDHPGSKDWSIRLYFVGDVCVADTNGDPVWEQDDPAAFAELLAEYGVETDA